VFTSGFDPVEIGLVASLNKPGGNLTGVSFFSAELSSKRLDILPAATSLALLINPGNPNTPREVADAEKAARAIGQTARVLYVSNDAEFEKVSGLLAKERPGALLVSSDPFLQARRDAVVALAARHTIPAMYFERAFVVDGGLVSYGASIAAAYHQAGIYVGKVIGGARPADLPIVRPTRFELVINLKTARALGLTVPDKLLALADEVIE
jgi:putative ABC transport system substrate-binding protein